LIDEGLVLYMKAPKSYTGEDVVELQLHGGVFVANKVLNLLLKYGCRLAEPGEYTKRAFLNGKIDMAMAEAVMNVIQADNDRALNISIRQLDGELSDKIRSLRERIIHENAYLEYALDDPEHVSLDGFKDKLLSIVDDILNEIKCLIDSYNEGRIVNEGVRTVIVGKPNAGKSSLLNVLLKEDRAIVTDVAGTTRDTLEEKAIIGGIPLNIVDTAGIRDTDDIVESIGVDKAKSEIDKSDLIIYVVDGSVKLSEEDREISEFIKDKNVIVILNKCDLDLQVTFDDIKMLFNKDISIIESSMKDNEGIDDFVNVLKGMFFKGEIDTNHDIIIANERQKDALIRSFDSLTNVKDSINADVSEDFYTIDLLEAYEALGDVIGESYSDDLLDKVFSDFCVGK
jgi:tRNA modification GTPase